MMINRLSDYPLDIMPVESTELISLAAIKKCQTISQKVLLKLMIYKSHGSSLNFVGRQSPSGQRCVGQCWASTLEYSNLKFAS